MQQLILQPLGIVTQPGKLTSLPPGAMSIADNVYIRSPFKIERAKPWQSGTGVGLGTSMRFWLLPTGSNAWQLVIYETTTNHWSCLWFSTLLSGFYSGLALTTEYGTLFLPRSDGSVWTVEANGWQYVNMDCGVACVEGSVDPAFTSGDPVTSAGIRSPRGFSSLGVATAPLAVAGGAIAWGYAAAYTAIIRRKASRGGAEFVSAPCASVFVGYKVGLETDFPSTNIGGTVFFQGIYARVGDLVEIYRTRTQPNAKSSAYTSLGSDYFRVCAIKLTSTDVSSGSVSFIDRSPDNSLGDALYTNDGFQGAEGIAYQPPAAACMAEFKGHTFYANIKQVAQIDLRPLNGWCSVDASATSGGVVSSENNYGRRTVSLSTTNGNVTVTILNTAIKPSLAVGQLINGTGMTSTTVITAVGATTITVSPAPTVTLNPNVCEVTDVIEINGTRYSALYDAGLLGQTVGASEPNLRVYGLEKYSPPMAAGLETGSQATALITIRLEEMGGARNGMSSFTIRSTRGKLFDPPLPSIELGETALTVSPIEQTDGWCCSEKQQPWRVPLGNYERLGGGQAVLALAPMKDCLLFFTTKGVKRLSGSGGSAGDGFDWRFDNIDETLVITGPRAWCVLRDVCYARTSRGVVAIHADGSVAPISEGIIGDVFPGRVIAPGTAYVVDTSTCVWMEADEASGEVLLFDYSTATAAIYRYNIVTKTWVTDTPGFTGISHGAYFAYEANMVVASNPVGSAGLPKLPVASPSSWTQPSKMHYQPVCGESAFQQKHWQDVDPLIVNGSAVTLSNVYINGVAQYTSQVLNAEGTINAKRRSFGVPRDAPAIAPTITIGVEVAAATSGIFESIGVAVTFEPVSADRIVR